VKGDKEKGEKARDDTEISETGDMRKIGFTISE
jgi:hypothetical protein